jgi:hypothetical protein
LWFVLSADSSSRYRATGSCGGGDGNSKQRQALTTPATDVYSISNGFGVGVGSGHWQLALFY